MLINHSVEGINVVRCSVFGQKSQTGLERHEGEYSVANCFQLKVAKTGS